MSLTDRSEWEGFITGHPKAHLLQTGTWGTLKSAFGWKAESVITRMDSGAIGALVLFRRVLPGFSLAYIPRGPIIEQPQEPRHMLPLWNNFWREVDVLCQSRRAVLLKLEPDAWEDEPAPFPFAQVTPQDPPAGFRKSTHAVQPPRTIIVSLAGSEEDILARMKQKTRYNIRLAQKKGVVVKPSSDLAQFNTLMQVTGQRDGFGVHSPEYYQHAYNLFKESEQCAILSASFEEEPLAALMVFRRGRRAWYLYGASSNNRRELMPTYLLQWEAMRWARQHDCDEYDLWGVPDLDEATLEAQFASRSDGLWGVYRFKRGFGGVVRRSTGSWDRVYLPPVYALYRWRTRKAEDAG